MQLGNFWWLCFERYVWSASILRFHSCLEISNKLGDLYGKNYHLLPVTALNFVKCCALINRNYTTYTVRKLSIATRKLSLAAYSVHYTTLVERSWQTGTFVLQLRLEQSYVRITVLLRNNVLHTFLCRWNSSALGIVEQPAWEVKMSTKSDLLGTVSALQNMPLRLTGGTHASSQFSEFIVYFLF